MSTCPFSSGWSLGCKNSSGGIAGVYARSYTATTVYTYSTDGTITGGTHTNTTWYSLAQRPEQAEFTWEGGHDQSTGSNAYTYKLNLTFLKSQASLRNLVYALAINDLEVIILDNNGKYFKLNDERSGAYTASSSGGVGKELTSMNGATVGIEAKSPTPAREVSSTFFSTLTIA